MIISHRYKFIFIKTRKTAGTSLEIALSKFLGPEDIVTPITPEDEKTRKQKGFVSSQNYRKNIFEIGLKDIYPTTGDIISKIFYTGQIPRSKNVWPMKFYNHIPAVLVQQRIGQAWNSYFKFSIERNSWDIALSRYFWNMKNRKEKVDFKDFIMSGGAYKSSNYDLYCIDGVPAMDRIVRYELLKSDLTRLSGQLKLPENLYEVLKKIRAKSNTGRRKNYRDMYDEDSKNIISIQFAREIKLMGYKF